MMVPTPEIKTIMTALSRSVWKPMGKAVEASAPEPYKRTLIGAWVATI